MGDYVPTTDEVREAYVVGVDPEVTARYRAEFDRWLAEVERTAAEVDFARGVHRALEITRQRAYPGDGLLTLIGNPYRAEAYRQERGEQ